jgi:hypothetical protein
MRTKRLVSSGVEVSAAGESLILRWYLEERGIQKNDTTMKKGA